VPGVFGPILSTCVALGTAAVVVANPVTAPHADVRIPANAMTTDTGNTADMLDENFIKAVGPAPEASNNPFVVLKDLVTALVVDATTIGKNAVIHAFVTGADVVSRPELTAASYPYVAPTPSDTVHIPFPAPPVPADLQPMLAQAVTAILAEGAAGDQAALGDAAAAALETGTALGGPDPTALLDKFRAVIASEVQPVWENALSVVTSLPQPTIGETVTNISHLSTLLDGADLSRRVTADPEATPPTEGPQPSGHDAAASLTRRVSAAPPALAATPPPLSAAPNGPKPSHPALSAAIGKLKATVAAARADRANKRSDRG
jgi:hypothetical protein